MPKQTGFRWVSSILFGLLTLIFSDVMLGVLLQFIMPDDLQAGDEFALWYSSLELVGIWLQIALAIMVASILMRIADGKQRTGWGLIVIGFLAALSAAIFLTGLETLDGELIGIAFYILVSLFGVPWQIVLAASLLLPLALLVWGRRLLGSAI